MSATTTSPLPVTAPRLAAAGAPESQAAPWWRHGYVWLILSGPAVVIVAGVFTAWLALRAPDPVLNTQTARQVLQSQQAEQASLLPAAQARNHASNLPNGGGAQSEAVKNPEKLGK